MAITALGLRSTLSTLRQLPTVSRYLAANVGLLQASAQNAGAVANNDPVGCWVGPSGIPVIQTTTASRPLLQTATPSLLFDGIDDYLRYAGPFTDKFGSAAIVFKTQSVAFTTARVLVSRADESSANNWFEIGIGSDGRIYIDSNANGTQHTVVGSSFLDLATAYFLAVTFDGWDYYAQVNAVEQNPLAITSTGTFAWFGNVPAGNANVVIGGAVTSAGLVRPFKGEIMEFGLYSTDITS